MWKSPFKIIFQKKKIFPWVRLQLTKVSSFRAEIEKYFRSFLVQIKTVEFALDLMTFSKERIKCIKTKSKLRSYCLVYILPVLQLTKRFVALFLGIFVKHFYDKPSIMVQIGSSKCGRNAYHSNEKLQPTSRLIC